MTKYGSWEVWGLGTGIAPLRDPPSPHPGYTPPHATRQQCTREQLHPGLKEAVGLKSVDQLTLCVVFSGFEGMTEVYNLIRIGRINNQFTIPGTK